MDNSRLTATSFASKIPSLSRTPYTPSSSQTAYPPSLSHLHNHVIQELRASQVPPLPAHTWNLPHTHQDAAHHHKPDKTPRTSHTSSENANSITPLSPNPCQKNSPRRTPIRKYNKTNKTTKQIRTPRDPDRTDFSKQRNAKQARIEQTGEAGIT